MADKTTVDGRFYGWINLVAAGVIGIIGGFYVVSHSYFLRPLVNTFGWDYEAVSRAQQINVIALGLCGPLAGFFIMKFGARRAIVLGNLLGFAGFLLLYFHSSLWQLYLGFGLLVGTAAGLGGMLATTTVVNNWFFRKRSMALGIFLGTGGLGGIFMGPSIQASIENYGWRNTYLFISLLVLVFAVIIPGILIRNKPADLGQVPDGPDRASVFSKKRKPVPPKAAYKTAVDFTLGEAVRTRCYWLLIAYFSMNMLAMNALMFPQIAYLEDIGIASIVAAFALSTMTGVMTFSQFGTGFLGMRFSMHSIAIGAEIIKTAGLVICVTTQSLFFAFVYMVVLGLSFGAFIVATMNIFPNYFGTAHYPKIMGFARLFFAIIGSFGAPIAGYIKDTTGSFVPAFRGSIVIVFIGILFLALARPPVHPSLKTPQPEAGPLDEPETA
ncbi:MAG: MFS transporter [Acidobacteria bacterium]|nr:MFS transporter [Acidobacteriota bacterium]